jgi:hypothetical protein
MDDGATESATGSETETETETETGAETEREAETGSETETETETEAEAEAAEAVTAARTRRTMHRTARMAQMAATPAGRGRLHVATPPGWADVYVDGRHVGRSATEIQLPAGSRRVRLVPYGEGPAINRRVSIEADGTSRLVVRLRD